MTKRWFLCFLICFTLSFELIAFPKASLRINPSQISGITDFEIFAPYFSEEMIRKLEDIPFAYNRGIQLLLEEDGVYAFSSCYLDVYRWSGEEWENLYGFDNKGYSCGSYPFFYQDQFYLVGGYGFWHNHTDLLHFEEEASSWSLITTRQQPMDYNTELVGRADHRVFLLLGLHHNPRLGIDNQFEHEGFVLDMETLAWSRLKMEGLISQESNKAEFLIQRGLGLDTEQFIVLNGFTSLTHQLGLVFFDKKTLELRFFRRDSPFDFFNFAPWTLIAGDQVVFRDDKNLVQTLEMDELYQNANYIGKAEIVPISNDPSDGKSSSLLLIWTGGFAALMALLFLVVKLFPSQTQFLRRVFFINQHLPEDGKDPISREVEESWKDVLLYQGESLTVDELDQILKLDSLASAENKKVRRSRLVKEINQYSETKWGYTLIQRKRNPDDKRYFLYDIHEVD
ncbi:MAG: hypothetical protein HWE15_15970 [Algoriphagus sp.]|uniref:hypothetical protein n=1 Tax=Algoriphagus sp. TaxID=1872435 RepID=UPI0017C70876|nr:hypothetical protein [Algoriphagus sp.]NVJ87801.1 hypothetical protein [Algoriphagus sp.]